jgi:hypothetical protein
MIVQFLGYHHLQEIYWRPEDKALDAAPVAKHAHRRWSLGTSVVHDSG